MFLNGFTSLSVVLCFPISILTSLSLCTVFDAISSNIDEVHLINSSANVFVFGNINIHHRDWLTYSGGTYRPDEPSYNFSIPNELTQMVGFPIWIPDCDSHSFSLLDFFLLTLVFVLQWLSLHW